MLPRWLFSGLTLLGTSVAGASLLGCDQGCDVDATCVPEGWPGTTGTGDDGCPEDPADGAVRPDCGVWVSASRGQDSSLGTQGEPVRSLAQAIVLAQAGPTRVYACGEVYAEPVSLPSGVSLFGGFDCQNNWVYRGMARRATIAPAPGEIALTMLEGDEESHVGDIEARSADAVKAGESSIAVLVQDEAKGVLRRADIIAGNGADGADGSDGDHDGFPAQKGLAGNDGTAACTAAPGLGGPPVNVTCADGSFSTGGPGGDGGELVASNGADGLPLPDPNPADYGIGGKGEAEAPTCTSGQGGVQGVSGEDGTPAPTIGDRRISKEGIVFGGKGGDGKSGVPGQGGGGGGASFAKPMICGAAPSGGAGGGSGGTGGCGGRGGRGGQAGGSSIGLGVRGMGVLFRDVRVTAGDGGNGGKGGQSQEGGQGGLPGAGGQGFGGAAGIKAGCGGGIGGPGGNGGDGAGGRGGHSAAIALIGVPYLTLEGKSPLLAGQPGLGGYGGNPAMPAENAYPGTSANMVTFDP